MEYRAFLSSTYVDLKEHRGRIIEALRHGDMHVRPMEEWAAAAAEPKELSQEGLNGCDLCILLVAFRRGHVPEGERLSITQLEYRAAVERNINVLTFLLEEGADWPAQFNELDRDQELRRWRSELAEHRVVGFFNSEPASLKIEAALLQWINRKRQQDSRSSSPDAVLSDPERLDQLESAIRDELVRVLAGGDDITAADAVGRFIEPQIRTGSDMDPEVLPLSELGGESRPRWLLRGEGGCGKSTALLRLAQQALDRARADVKAAVPVPVRLAHFDRAEGGIDRLMEIAGDRMGVDPSVMRSLCRTSKRPLLFLLDGLNEVRGQFQPACVRAVQELLDSPRHGVIITSRPVPALAPLEHTASGMRAGEFMRFTDDQIQEFLVRRHADDVFDVLGAELKELAGNPFTLWALSRWSIGRTGDPVPRNRGQLYASLIDRSIVARHEQRKSGTPVRYSYDLVKKPVLAGLALAMTRADVTSRAEDANTLREIREALSEMRKRYEEDPELIDPGELMPERPSAKGFLDETVETGILRRVDGNLEFMHPSVQEYFTAVGALDDEPESVALSVPPLVWRYLEVPTHDSVSTSSALWGSIVMLAGLTPDATSLVTVLSRRQPLLAAQCVAGAARVDAETRSALVGEWSSMLDRSDPRARWIGCRCLEMVPPSDPAIVTTLLSLALGDPAYFVNTASAQVLLKIGPDILAPRVVSAVARDPGFDPALDTRAANLCYRLSSPAIVKHLFDCWRDERSSQSQRRRIERFLGAVKKPIAVAEVTEIHARAAAAGNVALAAAADSCLRQLPAWGGSLGFPGFPLELFAEIATTLRRDSRRREERAREIVQMTAERDLPAMLLHSDYHMRRAAVARIEKLAMPSAVESIVEAVAREPDGSLLDAMARALVACTGSRAKASVRLERRMASEDRVHLFDLLHGDLTPGPVPKEVLEALEAHGRRVDRDSPLVRVGDTDAWELRTQVPEPEIINEDFRLEPRDGVLRVFLLHGRARAVRALGAIAGHAARDIIARAVSDADPFVRAAALSALRASGLALAFRGMYLEHLGDPEPRVRAIAAAALARDADEAVVMQLAGRLQRETHHRVADATIRSLAMTRSRAAVAPLVSECLRIAPGEDGRPELAWGVEQAWGDRIHAALVDLNAGRMVHELLMEQLDRPDGTARPSAIHELGRWMRREALVGPVVRDPAADDRDLKLVDIALSDPTAHTRDFAADALRWSTRADCVSLFTRELDAAAREKRARAVSALGHLLDQSAIPYLTAALADEDPHVRLAAAESIDRLFADADLGRAIAVALDTALGEWPADIRQAAGTTLGRMRSALPHFYQPVAIELSSGRFEEAVRLATDRLAARPGDPVLLFGRGYSYKQLKRFAEAAEDLEIAIRMKAAPIDWCLELAEVKAQMGQRADALADIRRAAEREPDSPKPLLAGGLLAIDARNYGEAVDWLQRAYTLDPSSSRVAFALGLAQLANGQPDSARSSYARGLQSLPTLPHQFRREVLTIAQADLDEVASSASFPADAVNDLKGLLQAAADGEAVPPPDMSALA